MSARLGHCLVVALALCLVMLVRAGSAGTDQSAAPPTATFVGAKACASCHQDMHDTWSGGRHSKMLQPATASSVVGDFAKGSAVLHGNRFQLRSANGEFFIAESYLTGKLREHRVEYTLGSRRVQHYLTTMEKGRMVVLPPSWDVQRREWFDNMDIVRPRQDRGSADPAMEQGLCRLSRQRRGQTFQPGDAGVPHRLERFRHLVRALPWTRQPARRRLLRGPEDAAPWASA